MIATVSVRKGQGARRLAQAAVVLALAAGLAACAPKEEILPGERLDPRTPLTEGSLPAEGWQAAPTANESRAVALGGGAVNADWAARAANARHDPGNVALGPSLRRLWSVPVGAGSDRKHRIAADPVVGGGRIYTLDAQARVTATGTGGGTAWSTDLTPASDRAGDASGGGISFGGGRVFVTTGFGELVALDAGSGAVLWRQRFDAAASGGPTVSGDLVFAVSRDGTGWALDAANGKIAWQVSGVARAGVIGVSSPASDGQVVVFPFASGQMVAADVAKGAPVWMASVAGRRLGMAYASVSDLTGDPVIAGNMVLAGSGAGRLAAFDKTTGQQIWSADEGAASPPAVAGGAVFIVSDEAQLIRLEAGSGRKVWAVDLPHYLPVRKERKRRDIFVNYGPVIAGGRLVVASSDGVIRGFDPASGALLSQTALPAGAAAAPAVAGGTLYVLGTDGRLSAFR